jgi:WXXGXW repeat (2 copies)
MTLKKIIATTTLALGTALITPTAFARVDVGITVRSMPPAPRVAPGPIGVAPGAGYVWTNGYWDWTGGRWAWVGGRWMAPPHGHHVWVEPRYQAEHGHYHYHRGYWR